MVVAVRNVHAARSDSACRARSSRPWSLRSCSIQLRAPAGTIATLFSYLTGVRLGGSAWA